MKITARFAGLFAKRSSLNPHPAIASLRRLVFSLLLFLSLVSLAHAALASPYWRRNTLEFAKEVEGTSATADPPNVVNQKRFSATMGIDAISTIGYGILDPSGVNRLAAVNTVGNAIAAITSYPPVQTRDYLAYMASKAGFVDQAYAQRPGGFGVLEPIQKLWIATRNIAYLVTSLTLIVIGVMIMLRRKIDAQTVIGVQQALPKLALTLLLITFSYAIAGLVIDLIYFLIYFVIKLLDTLGGVFTDNGNAAIRTILNSNLFNIGLTEIFSLQGSVASAANAVGSLAANLLSGTVGTFVSAGAGLISQPIAFVIFAVAILFAIFKLFFALLMAYIQIIILTILGPLQLMLNAMPGSDAFSKWFRNLLANALAFPAAALMIVFAAALTNQDTASWMIDPSIGFTHVISGVAWIPPLVFGQGSTVPGTPSPVAAVQALFGIGILLMTPKVVDMVKEWVQAPEFKYGSAIGEAVGFGGQAPGFMSRAGAGGFEFRRGLRYAKDPAYMQSLMFTNPELYKRLTDAQAAGPTGRLVHGLRYALKSGRGK